MVKMCGPFVAFGYIHPTPGTPVPLMPTSAEWANLTVQSIDFISGKSPGVENTGNAHIGLAGMNKSTGEGVLKTLKPGDDWVISQGTKHDFPYNPTLIFIDCDTLGDGVGVTAVRA